MVYRDGYIGFMKQLRLAGSLMAISIASLDIITMDLKASRNNCASQEFMAILFSPIGPDKPPAGVAAPK